MKIVELKIDDVSEEAGVDGIALVERPAVEEDWFYFNEDKIYIIPTDEGIELAEKINELGEDIADLTEEGWKVVSVKPVRSGKDVFSTIIANPNESSAKDGVDPNSGDSYRIRYKYAGPQDSKNREFCGDMMSANKVFRYEDIMEMSSQLVNPVSKGTYYSIFEYRGSYNCRHQWVELKYKMEGRILNNSNVKRGLKGSELLPDQLTTETNATANKKAFSGVKRHLFEEFIMVDGLPAFVDQESAVIISKHMGCEEGSHEHKVDGKTYYMPCIKHQFETYNDYPVSAKNNACKVLKWRDEYGDEVKGMTRVGWTRANQLCKGENISESTIARMSGFQRHRKNAEVSPENKSTPWKDAGRVAWLGWGGTSGVNWASDKLKSIRKDFEETLDGENPCWDGYEPIGTKMKDGRKVPNCVKKSKNKEQQFSMDDEKRMIYGPAMIPNKFIIRQDQFTGKPYYVFFSKKTINQLSQKYLKKKYTDKTNIEHTPVNLKGVNVVESWIIEDSDYDKSIKLGFKKLPEGTWMIGMKVDDDKVWDYIKQGKLKGFSVEGYFTEDLLFNKQDEQVQIINEIINKISNE